MAHKFSSKNDEVINELNVMAKIKVENTEISVVNVQNEGNISLTDLASGKSCTIPILIAPNSIQLEMQPSATTLCFPLMDRLTLYYA